MNLDIIKIFQFNIMTSGNLHAVTGQVVEISGMLLLAGLNAQQMKKVISIVDRKEAIRTACMLAKKGAFCCLLWCSSCTNTP